MSLGQVALNPDTEYHVYEYAVGEKVFYVGISWSDVRSHGRWGHVRNLVRHLDAGTLKPAKASDLKRKSNQVIAALIRAGLPEHTVRIHWRGKGRLAAEAAESKRIAELRQQGHILANEAKNPKRATLAELLVYLGLSET